MRQGLDNIDNHMHFTARAIFFFILFQFAVSPHVWAESNLGVLTPEMEQEILLEIQQNSEQLKDVLAPFTKKGIYSLSQMVEIALQDNREMLIQEQEVRIASEQISKSRSAILPFSNLTFTQTQYEDRSPTLSFDENGFSSVTPDTPDIKSSYKSELSLGYRFSWSNWVRESQSETNYELKQKNLDRTRNDTLLQLRKAYFELIRQNYALRVFRDSVVRAKEHLNIVTARVELGKQANVEMLEARRVLEQARQDLHRGFFARQQASTDLAILLDWHPLSVYQIELRFPQEEPGFVVNNLAISEQYVQTALTSHPEVQELHLQEKLIEQSVSIAKADFWPTVTLSTGYSWNDDASFTTEEQKRTWSLVAQVNVPLFNGFQHSASLNESLLKREQMRHQSARLYSLTIKESVNLLSEIQLNANAIRIGKLQLQIAEDAYKIQKDLFGVGRGTIADLADQSLSLTQAQLSIIQNRYSYNTSLAKLENMLAQSLDWSKPAEEQAFINPNK